MLYSHTKNELNQQDTALITYKFNLCNDQDIFHKEHKIWHYQYENITEMSVDFKI